MPPPRRCTLASNLKRPFRNVRNVCRVYSVLRRLWARWISRSVSFTRELLCKYRIFESGINAGKRKEFMLILCLQLLWRFKIDNRQVIVQFMEDKWRIFRFVEIGWIFLLRGWLDAKGGVNPLLYGLYKLWSIQLF